MNNWMQNRNPPNNKIVQLINSEPDGWDKFKKVMLSPDLSNSLRNEVTQVLNYIYEGNFNLVIECAFYGCNSPDKPLDKQNNEEYVILHCAHALVSTSRQIKSKIIEEKEIIKESIIKFFNNPRDQKLCGNVSRVIQSMTRSGENIVPAFFHKIILENIHIFAFRDLFSQMLNEKPEFLFEPNNFQEGIIDSFKIMEDLVFDPINDYENMITKLYNFEMAIHTAINDKGEIYEELRSIEIILSLLSSMEQLLNLWNTLKSDDKNIPIAFTEGFRLIRKLLMFKNEAKKKDNKSHLALLKSIKYKGEVFDKYWSSIIKDKTKLMKIRCAVFPIFWQYLITEMTESFFEDPPISAKFNISFLDIAYNMNENQLIKFLTLKYSNKMTVLDLIIEKFPLLPSDPKLRGSLEAKTILNGHIYHLALFIIYGYEKTENDFQDDYGNNEKSCVTSLNKVNYEGKISEEQIQKFSEFIISKFYKLKDIIDQTRADAAKNQNNFF